MLRKAFKLFLPTLFWTVFVYVIFNTSYPKSITDASFYQLGAFFAPLILALILSLKLILKSFYKSIIVTLGIVLLFILKSLDALNLITTIITIAAVILLMGSFNRVHKTI